jgi:hypothetical protein
MNVGNKVAIVLIFGAISSAMLMVFVVPLLYRRTMNGEVDTFANRIQIKGNNSAIG